MNRKWNEKENSHKQTHEPNQAHGYKVEFVVFAPQMNSQAVRAAAAWVKAIMFKLNWWCLMVQRGIMSKTIYICCIIALKLPKFTTTTTTTARLLLLLLFPALFLSVLRVLYLHSSGMEQQRQRQEHCCRRIVWSQKPYRTDYCANDSEWVEWGPQSDDLSSTSSFHFPLGSRLSIVHHPKHLN